MNIKILECEKLCTKPLENECENCPRNERNNFLYDYFKHKLGSTVYVGKYLNWLNKNIINCVHDGFVITVPESINEKYLNQYMKIVEQEIEQGKIKQLDNFIKDLYPKAVSVEVFVNHQEIKITPTYRTELHGISMKNLSGEWVK